MQLGTATCATKIEPSGGQGQSTEHQCWHCEEAERLCYLDYVRRTNSGSWPVSVARWDPGEPITALGEVIARHTKGNSTGYKAERPNIRVVNKSRFREVGTMTELARELFGTALEPCGPAASTMTRVP